MLKSDPASAAYREQLVAALRRQGAIRSQPIADAFATIPRERFLPAFYERVDREWVLHRFSEEASAWVRWIYQDEALVTQLDARALPRSSSSQPSVMARMLEALDVQPGQRVLEIGTGTGYNAALLAHLTGDPHAVTAIELDATLARQAEQVLHEVVGPVQVNAGDGRLGDSSRAPFDRIIVTASTDRIARPWFAQLAPGGRLVLPLQGSLQASGFLVIEKTGQEGHGAFLHPTLHFLSLRSEDEPEEHSSRELFQQPVLQEVFLEASDPLLQAVQEEPFRWFLQWAWPEHGALQILPMTSPEGKQALLLKDARLVSILQVSQRSDGSWSGKSHGSVPLWSTIKDLAAFYQQIGQPGQEAFQVCLENNQAALIVMIDGKAYYLRDLFSA
jgi:protein-L-isoaspartate(D-aspartate) O-methyltransferase